MQLFLFLLIAVFLCFLLISLLSPPPPVEEDESELWEPTELRLESLLQGTLDPRPHIRDSYHNQILSMGPGVIPRLINALSQELCFAQPNSVWCERVETLLQDFGLQAVPALMEWLRDEGDSPEVVESAQRILIAYDTPVLRLLMSHLEPTLLPSLAPVFRLWGKSSARLALRAFQREPRRKLWQQLLVELREHAVEGLIEGTQSWRGAAQHQAFFVLARLASSEASEIFLNALHDVDIHKRMAAVRALEKIRNPEHWGALEPLLEDPAEEVRALSIQVMAHLGEEKAKEPLLTFWETVRNEPSRLYEALLSTVVLAELGVPVPLEMVERGLQSNTISRQRLALQLLSYIEPEERLEYLLPLLENPAESIVSDTVRLLVEMESSYVLERLMQRARHLPPGHRHQRIIEDAMMQLDEWATPYLCQTLQDEHRDPRVHALALKSLLYSGDQRALEQVLESIQRVDDPEVEWDISPQDVYLFLRRLNQKHDLEPVLRRFLDNHPESAMAPALQLFLEQSNNESLSPFSFDARSSRT